LIFGVLSLGYFQWIIQTIRRGEMREKYGIEGSCCGDCCTTFWCGCCALVQEEKEMELRTRPELTGYKSTPQMAYC
jgi:Cys-rich protein (TIGR01571 family)